jgi:predicted nuclease of predicted toxin-antitoxin system
VNLLADECCDALLVAGLRGDGHDAAYVRESAHGSDDQTVLQMAASQQRILITEDKDFGELVVRLKWPAFGIILVRINPSETPLKLARLRDLFQHHAHRLPGFFVVVDESRSRFRPL